MCNTSPADRWQTPSLPKCYKAGTPPAGCQLARSHKRERIELLELDASGIHVAEYLTTLPPREVLQAKLHEAIARSRARLENSSGEKA